MHVFDCFACAIHRMAPICEHCRVPDHRPGRRGRRALVLRCALRPGRGQGGHRRPVSDSARPHGPSPATPCRRGTPRPQLYGRGVYRFLLSRQWVILTLLALVLIPTMVKLGFWQLHRHEHRVAQNQLIAQQPQGRQPVPVEPAHLPRPRRPARRHCTARSPPRGTYDTAHEVVVRQRTAADEQSIGYHVLTPLVLDDGRCGPGQPRLDPRRRRPQRAFPESRPPPGARSPSPGGCMADETTGDQRHQGHAGACRTARSC